MNMRTGIIASIAVIATAAAICLAEPALAADPQATEADPAIQQPVPPPPAPISEDEMRQRRAERQQLAPRVSRADRDARKKPRADEKGGRKAAKLAPPLNDVAGAVAAAPELPPNPEDGVAFNFVDVEITSVAKFISELTGTNFILDERVSGKVTIIAPTKLKPNDAYNLFTSVLQLKGYALVPSGVNVLKIIPAAEAKQSNVAITDRKLVDENFIARLIPLDHISSDEALAFLQPMVSKTGYISSFSPGNLLLVMDSGLNIKKLLSLIDSIDQPTLTEEPEVAQLEFANAETMSALLNEGVQKSTVRKRGGRGVPSTPETATARAVADTRLNAVILFGSKSDKEAMRRLIALLDVPAKLEQGVVNVYFLENADADEIAKVLQSLLSAAPAQSAGSGRVATPRQPAAPGQPAASTVLYSPFMSSANIGITPDKFTNSLVIVASPSDYQGIVGVIKQLDRRRKQVYVEAMIVEASLDNLLDLGSKWREFGTHNGEPLVIGGVGTIDNEAVQNIITGLSGMSLGGFGNYMDIDYTDVSTGESTTLSIPGFAALFSLSEFSSAVNVLSIPQILTTDNTEAEIVVGENVPFITKTDVSSSSTTTTSIERKDVGISLKLTPQIAQGDYVKLDLYQEISSVKDSSEEIYTSVGPTTTKRSTKTTVVVKDEQTVVIGGLIQESVTETETRVPLLHRIPLLGWLFKYKTDSKKKTNLLVFLTPHIIKDAADMDRVTESKSRQYAKTENTFVEGELLVKFNPDVTDEQARKIIAKEKATIISVLADGTYYIKLKKRADVEDAAEDFADMDEVAYAEPNFKMKAHQQ